VPSASPGTCLPASAANGMPHHGLVRPRYDSGGLASVMPAVAASLGVHSEKASAFLGLAPARRAVVVLVDGLGYEQLRRRGGHAPFLRALLPSAQRLTAGFPSTTATSMGTFGTGLPPGTHGLLGYEVLVPGEDRLVNELSWENGPDPFTWQPEETVFQRIAEAGVAVTRVGPRFFDGSGLTNAALRGGQFRAAESLADRVTATLAALLEAPRSLVYLYWGDLDKVGHVNGVASWEWGEELGAIDAELRRLVESVPADTAVTVTADHGMVDSPHALRIDVAHDTELDAGVRHIGGEPRALQLYCEPGAVEDVLATWRARVEERAWIRSRDQAVAEGWFGALAPRNLPRIGDVIVAMCDNFAIVDSRRLRPQLLALLGLHGSLTQDETAVPLIHVPPRHTA
jgi:Type I phosphodiesterase / nucleotide pyrophosphatase